jgi:hypothetical protein
MSSANDTENASGKEPPNPRGFAMATGAMFQSIGCILMLGGCCLWSFSPRLVAPDADPPEAWIGHFVDRGSAVAWTVGVVVSFIGGLALAAVGMGLQGERPSSGRLSVIVTALLAVVFAAIAIVLVVREDRWGVATIPLILAGGMALLLLFALRSTYLFKRYPPPAHTEATDEIMEEIRRKRQERRKYYDE